MSVSDSGGSSIGLKEFFLAVKKDLKKSKCSSKTLSDFSSSQIYSSKDVSFKFFFAPLLMSPDQIQKKYEEELKAKVPEKQPLHQMLKIVTSWYFVKNKEKEGKEYKMQYKVRDFKKFVKQLHKLGVPFKLVLSEFGKKVNFLHKLYCQYRTDFGSVHAALQIGPYLIDWNASELVSIRPLKVNKCLLVLDLCTIQKDTQKKFYKKLNDLIWDWNMLYSYDYKTRKISDIRKRHKGNCHGFVECVFDFLQSECNIKCAPERVYTHTGPVVMYLNYIKRWDVKARGKKFVDKDAGIPKSEGKYKELEEKFEKTKVKKKYRKHSVYDFKSHAELDKKVLDLLGVPDITKIQKTSTALYEKLMLLKAFDRSFWYENSEGEVFNYRKCPLIFAKCGQFSFTRNTDAKNLSDEEVAKLKEEEERVFKERKKEAEGYEELLGNCL